VKRLNDFDAHLPHPSIKGTKQTRRSTAYDGDVINLLILCQLAAQTQSPLFANSGIRSQKILAPHFAKSTCDEGIG
jgi:hypothetical protein